MKLIHWIFLVLIINTTVVHSQNWRSTLYPENWQPGFSDAEGRFLHDFSYAGYHSGLSEIPVLKSNVVKVTDAPFNADIKGRNDATAAIQNAIDYVGSKGGGVVFLPAGEYKISVPDERKYGIIIPYNNVILRGEGTQKTFLKCVTTNIRSKTVLLLSGQGASWDKPIDKPVTLTADINLPTQTIAVSDVNAFKKGDLVCLTCDVTDDFAREHGSLSYWKTIRGPVFCREIVAVDTKNKNLIIDVPTRYPLKMRDNARVSVIKPQLSESGLENFSIGNVQHTATEWNDNDFQTAGTGGYDVHASQVIQLKNTANCWVKSVATFRPVENTADIHVLSNCLVVNDSRFVTIEKCDFRKPQYKGEGGNGYMYCLSANDCLIKDCFAENGRHNYDFKGMVSNGNVILNCTGKDSRLASDFHMQLSMANLFDSFVADGDYLDAAFRPYGSMGAMHMYSTTQSVFWNTIGIKKHNASNYLIDSRQFGYGYIIGTSGKSSAVLTTPVSGTKGKIEFNTGPEDFTEGITKGETLIPQSLYRDQLDKRKAGIKNQLAKNYPKLK